MIDTKEVVMVADMVVQDITIATVVPTIAMGTKDEMTGAMVVVVLAMEEIGTGDMEIETGDMQIETGDMEIGTGDMEGIGMATEVTVATEGTTTIEVTVAIEDMVVTGAMIGDMAATGDMVEIEATMAQTIEVAENYNISLFELIL